MRFIETIRVENGQLCNLDLHKKRAKETILFHFGVKKSLPFDMLVPVDISLTKGTYKLRVVYSKDIEEFSIDQYVPRTIKRLRIVDGEGIDYRFKYENRSAIEALLSLKTDCDDLLIIKDGYVTDTSYTNVVFAQGEDLFTPSTFLLNGVKRQSLLREGRIKERDIRVDDIKKYDGCFLINAMLDYTPNCVVLIKGDSFC
ncbi:MAG: hypothetical protein A2X18_06425 [Bacteroidetes bacterium GWF2_40_14]|nr:MAG: hypothetical protein A2X18_06425 [Bacteroidetes bacterium GWF2_40_14]